jgi:hypothetical protein
MSYFKGVSKATPDQSASPRQQDRSHQSHV